jgi:hypothetical protein
MNYCYFNIFYIILKLNSLKNYEEFPLFSFYIEVCLFIYYEDEWLKKLSVLNL